MRNVSGCPGIVFPASGQKRPVFPKDRPRFSDSEEESGVRGALMQFKPSGSVAGTKRAQMAHFDDAQTVRANLTFIKPSMKVPLLTREREYELARRWRCAADTAALHELVCAHTRLVVSIAARFRHYALPMADLVQEGHVGLMRGAARFEPDRGVRFSTYAAWWIRSAMQDYVLRNWSIVRPGTNPRQKSLFFKLRFLRARTKESSGAPLTDAGRRKIANELQVDLADVESMEIRLGAADQSLNARVGGSGEDDWQGFVPDQRPNPEQVVTSTHDGESCSRWLAEAIGELSSRERAIVRQRRLQEKAATLEELGHMLGVSKERVRQLERRALAKLAKSLRCRVEHASDLFADGVHG